MAGKENYFFQYNPSVAAVVVAVIVFGAITAIHIYRFVKTWKTLRIKMLIVLSMASFNEVLGYALRVPGSKNKPTGALFALSPLLFLFTPLMVTSVTYFVFNKISTNIAPQSVPIKPSLMLKVLSGVDIACQLAISAGAMVASRNDDYSAGKGILLAGIGIHIVNVAAFMAAVALWHRRSFGKWTPDSTQSVTSTQRDILAMYVTCGLITLRSLMRFVEIASGADGPLQDHEAPFYFYDFLPMAIAFTACLQWYGSGNLETSP